LVRTSSSITDPVVSLIRIVGVEQLKFNAWCQAAFRRSAPLVSKTAGMLAEVPQIWARHLLCEFLCAPGTPENARAHTITTMGAYLLG
jgi:hypothetical protein